MHLALEKYTPPSWAESLSAIPKQRVRLMSAPTPMHAWSVPSFSKDVELSIKRDDLTGMALSGNKVRKLEFLLADAIERGCDCVITCGGIQSNHCRATAIAACQLGLTCTVLLRTDDVGCDPGVVGNLLPLRMVGTDIVLMTAAEHQNRVARMEEVAGQLRGRGHNPYIIPEGGSNGLGCWGYLEAVCEMLGQWDAVGCMPDDLVVACGSGGTAAGLALGVKLRGAPVKVHAVNVCNNAAYFYEQVNAIFREMGATFSAEDTLDIIDGYVGKGYAQIGDKDLQLILEVAKTSGILLDPVYTGKTFCGMCDSLKTSPKRFAGKCVAFVHTGGHFGLFDKAERLHGLMK